MMAISQFHPCGCIGTSMCFVIHGSECVYCTGVIQNEHIQWYPQHLAINKRTGASFQWVLHCHAEDETKDPAELLTPRHTHTHQQRPSVRFCLVLETFPLVTSNPTMVTLALFTTGWISVYLFLIYSCLILNYFCDVIYMIVKHKTTYICSFMLKLVV